MIPTFLTISTVLALACANSGLGLASALPPAEQSAILYERHISDEAAFPEMRASIVDREGDQFIAKTEEGHEFRLPVQGAPADTKIGDELRLVPDPDTHTMNVFKADPAEGGTAEKPESQL